MKLLINYNNIDTKKQDILGKSVWTNEERQITKPKNLEGSDRVRLKEKTKLVDEVKDSV